MPISVQVGQTATFVVVCADAAGNPVPDTNGAITVASSSAANFTATVNADGTGGVVTGVAAGSGTLTATDGKLTSTPDAVTVSENLTPTTLTIVP